MAYAEKLKGESNYVTNITVGQEIESLKKVYNFENETSFTSYKPEPESGDAATVLGKRKNDSKNNEINFKVESPNYIVVEFGKQQNRIDNLESEIADLKKKIIQANLKLL